jgi:tripartite-type tricarboxylate transporter receptor subunit TctC
MQRCSVDKRPCADLPQNQADSHCRRNFATLSAVHKKVQGKPVRDTRVDAFGAPDATIRRQFYGERVTLPMPESIPGLRVRCCTRAALALAFAFLLILPASAASFPDRPIKLIVPFAPGGPPDVAARIIGDWLSTHLGPIVVENHVGAGGTLAARMVASAPPDGYTLMAATSGSLAISPQLYKNAGIDPVKDFTAVALLSSTPQVLAINASMPVRSVKELVAYAKANPGKLNYGAVISTPPHLSGEMFKHLTGADIVFVPYKGASQATTDVLSGQMNMTFEGATGIMPYLKSGKLRALAVTSPHRLPEIPDVPTMIEAGYPGMPPDAWQAIVAPAGTPPAILDQINAIVNQGLADPQVRNRIVGLGGVPQPMSPKDFAAFIAEQTQRWGEIIRITGVKLE